MTNPRLAGLWSAALSIAAVVAYAVSQHPDRIALLFAAVIFAVNGAADRVIAHIKQAAT